MLTVFYFIIITLQLYNLYYITNIMLYNFFKEIHFSTFFYFLKPASAIFYFLFFSPNDSPSKTIKKLLFHGSFSSKDIPYIAIFSLSFHIVQIQKLKLEWNNL